MVAQIRLPLNFEVQTVQMKANKVDFSDCMLVLRGVRVKNLYLSSHNSLTHAFFDLELRVSGIAKIQGRPLRLNRPLMAVTQSPAHLT